MESDLVVVQFDSRESADLALSTLRGLDAEGFLSLEDAAVISEGDEASSDLGATTAGGLLGLVAGAVVGLPVVGALVGAGIASRKPQHAERLSNLIESAGKDVPSGSATLAFLVESLNDPEIVFDRLGIHRDKVLRAEVPWELRAEIDRASATELDGPGDD